MEGFSANSTRSCELCLKILLKIKIIFQQNCVECLILYLVDNDNCREKNFLNYRVYAWTKMSSLVAAGFAYINIFINILSGNFLASFAVSMNMNRPSLSIEGIRRNFNSLYFQYACFLRFTLKLSCSSISGSHQFRNILCRYTHVSPCQILLLLQVPTPIFSPTLSLVIICSQLLLLLDSCLPLPALTMKVEKLQRPGSDCFWDLTSAMVCNLLF